MNIRHVKANDTERTDALLLRQSRLSRYIHRAAIAVTGVLPRLS